MTWRERYRPIIAGIIKDNADKSIKDLKKILQKANPGQYGHMKKTWANEYMLQLGLSKVKKRNNSSSSQQLTLL